MELSVGMTFTGSIQCFTGRIEVLEVDESNSRLTTMHIYARNNRICAVENT